MNLSERFSCEDEITDNPPGAVEVEAGFLHQHIYWRTSCGKASSFTETLEKKEKNAKCIKQKYFKMIILLTNIIQHQFLCLHLYRTESQ